MCLIALAWQSYPDCPLIIAANRDEFFERATLPAQWWASDPRILAGQDLAAGGTWMGVTRDGRFAALTNVRQSGTHPARRSRGELVAAWLGGRRDETAMTAAEIAFRAGKEYGGFHLLLGSIASRDAAGHSSTSSNSLVWTCNRDGGEPRHLGTGIWAWSNGEPGHEWPKTQKLISALRLTAPTLEPRSDPNSALNPALNPAIAPASAGATQNWLLQALADTTPAPDELLPDTGIDLARERALSSPFIPAHLLPNGSRYGTRASTLVRVSKDQALHWLERTFESDGSHSDRSEVFQIQSLGVSS